MISAIITASAASSRLGQTLATLTPAALDGLVREVIIADGGASSDALALAEETGARIITGSAEMVLDQACAAARRPWLLILTAGARLEVGWEAAARGHMRRHPGAAAWFRLRLAQPGIPARLDEAWSAAAARWLGRLRPEQGLLIAQGQWARPAGPRRPLSARILIGGEDQPDDQASA